jgi:hypothetical protein
MTLDLSALERLAKAATPGPWRNGADPCHFDSPEVTDDKTFSYYVKTDADAAFIAALSPSTALALIAHIRKLEAVAEAARKFARVYHHHPINADVIELVRVVDTLSPEQP